MSLENDDMTVIEEIKTMVERYETHWIGEKHHILYLNPEDFCSNASYPSKLGPNHLLEALHLCSSFSKDFLHLKMEGHRNSKVKAFSHLPPSCHHSTQFFILWTIHPESWSFMVFFRLKFEPLMEVLAVKAPKFDIFLKLCSSPLKS